MSDTLITGPITLERIHRLGKLAKRKVRPVMLKLLDHRDKNRVLENCFKLNGSTYAISEDFSSRVREVRRKLCNCARKFKQAEYKVTLSYDKIRINGELFVADSEKNYIAPVVSGSGIGVRPTQPGSCTDIAPAPPTYESEIAFLNINAHSILSKKDCLEELLISLVLDFVAITVSCLSSDI